MGTAARCGMLYCGMRIGFSIVCILVVIAASGFAIPGFALEDQSKGIQALPASTSSPGLFPRILARVSDLWKQWATDIARDTSLEQESSLQSVVITGSGKARLTDALVVSVGADSFSAQEWGLIFRVSIDAGTLFSFGRIRQWSFLEMRAGDRVDVIGMIAEQGGLIRASAVNRRVVQRAAEQADLGALQKRVEELMRKAQEFLSGRASSSAPLAR